MSEVTTPYVAIRPGDRASSEAMTEAILDRIERRLQAADAYESLWRITRFSDDERALLVAREFAS